MHGETIETAPKTKLAYTLLEPLGVAGQVIPWNYPVRSLSACHRLSLTQLDLQIGMWGWKVAPALAA